MDDALEVRLRNITAAAAALLHRVGRISKRLDVIEVRLSGTTQAEKRAKLSFRQRLEFAVRLDRVEARLAQIEATLVSFNGRTGPS